MNENDKLINGNMVKQGVNINNRGTNNVVFKAVVIIRYIM